MKEIVSVSQLNTYIASLFRENNIFRRIMVRGEISNFVCYGSTGHCYFTLKEGNTAIKAVMFGRYAGGLAFRPENGMKVIVTANVDVYERDGVYQLVVSDMTVDGIGDLFMQIEQLKQKLRDEGCFDEEHKKQIPFFPRRIAVVTSRQGAALQDILNIIKRRCPVVDVFLFSCSVQGINAPDTIAQALSRADRFGCDVIICGRGGGSVEDLMAFNSEKVARAVFECNTPVISAVGHETDTTVIDLVSDLRAPTPSAAAELCVPLLSDITDSLSVRYAELVGAMNKLFEDREMRLDNAEGRLALCSPEAVIKNTEQRLEAVGKLLVSEMEKYLAQRESRLGLCSARLDDLSPLRVMSRGYSIVYKNDKPVTHKDELCSGDRIGIRMSDGEIFAVCE